MRIVLILLREIEESREEGGGRRENIPVSSGAVPSFPCLTTTDFAQSGEV